MTRPRLLDLFGGAGGCGMGYNLAGFEVVGVDLDEQPEYPFEFIQADALDVLADREFVSTFDAVHASPPCQAFSPLAALPRAGVRRPAVDLIEPTRAGLQATGLPYVIENVVQAPLASATDLLGNHGTMLCGTMFGLKVFRHRKFETNFPVAAREHPRHRHLAMRAGYLPTDERPFMSVHGRGGHNSKAWVKAAAHAMGAPWMTALDGVCEAVPPAYTEYVGAQLLGSLAALEATA